MLKLIGTVAIWADQVRFSYAVGAVRIAGEQVDLDLWGSSEDKNETRYQKGWSLWADARLGESDSADRLE
jgi:hypothetical protein